MSDPLPAQPCADIEPMQVTWFWKPYLARGKLCVLDGDPGTGKSFFTVDLAARLSRGGPMPDGQPLPRPCVTLLMNAEDDWADTVRPRVEAAGADLSRVFVVGSQSGSDPHPTFPECYHDIVRLVAKYRADLLVIDPMMAYFPPRACANSDQRIRQALSQPAALAHDSHCAVLLVRHLSKAAGANAVYRGSGSIGILGSARTGLLLASHPDDPDLRVLAMTKTNLGPPAPSLGFRLADGDGGAAHPVDRAGRSDGGRVVRRAGGDGVAPPAQARRGIPGGRPGARPAPGERTGSARGRSGAELEDGGACEGRDEGEGRAGA